MNVRLATVRDMQTLLDVRFDYFDTENRKLTDKEKAQIRSQLPQYYAAHINRDFYAALVYESGGVLASVAFLVLSEKPANPSFPTGKTGMMLNVLTYPPYREKGYATAALRLLMDLAKKENLSYIELSASKLGKPLYEKLGFTVTKPSEFTEMKWSISPSDRLLHTRQE